MIMAREIQEPDLEISYGKKHKTGKKKYYQLVEKNKKLKSKNRRLKIKSQPLRKKETNSISILLEAEQIVNTWLF